jgi:hypothetical protein
VEDGVDDAALDRLFAAAPEDFVATREAIARELKETGDAGAAAAVRSFAKPTLPVWLVNRLARERKADVRELVKAGERLREAHAGGDLKAFRTATERERDAVAKLTDAARQLAAADRRKVSDAMLARVGSTLHAAAADEQARFPLAQGRLTEELEPAGFELLAGLAPAPASGGRANQQREHDGRAERRRQLATAKKELTAAKAAVRERRKAVEDAERALERARSELERAEADAEEAERRVEDLG